jgi:adenylate cyclase
MFLIFIFAVACIFGSLMVRDIDTSSYFSKFLNFTVSFEDRFYDYRMVSQLDPKFMSKEIVLVKIDDYSLQKIGVFPIPRTNYATMLDKLGTFGAKVIALDILFPERSPQLGNLSPDTVLAESIKKFQTDDRRVFLAYTVGNGEGEHFEEAPLSLLNDAVLTRNVPESDFRPMKVDRYTFPIPELVDSEAGLGYISVREDRDGIFRHYQVVANVDTIYYGSLAFNSFEAFTGEKHTVNIYADSTGELEVNDHKLELSHNGETKIRYAGGEGNFKEVSLYDLIEASDEDPKMKEIFSGKIVYIGSTAIGAHDLRPSPIDAKMPGVFSHMNMTHMLIHNYFYKNLNESIKYSLLLLFLGMVLFLFVQRWGNPFLDALVMIFIIGGSYYADQLYFIPQGYELKLFYCYFCFVACYTWNTFLQFYESNKEKKQIRGTFARYVAPTIVDEMLKDPDNLHVGGSKMDITCLFSDVRDFTKISESLTATELAQSLNMYMGRMTDIVFDTKGTLDKYIGDAIVALWGAPLPIGNHAQFAVEAAIQMMEALPGINEDFKRLGRPLFKIGIGLNSGECSVGNMGSDRIFSYTALGDNMNLGARLESLCKHYGGDILISDMTLERLDLTKIKTRPIDKVIVKGKSTPVGVHEVLHAHHWMSKDPESLSFYLTAYQLFQMKNFVAALDVFSQLLMSNPEDKPSERFKKICQKYLDHPELVTEDFDITTMTEK